jgi:glycosyltransferase involved in cell wall biosynthesis
MAGDSSARDQTPRVGVPPLVSVIVPVINQERLLPEAIACIRQQGDEHVEIVAVDDGSTDGTPEVLERLRREPGARLRVVREDDNTGPGAARNAGARAARGEIFAFLDADDLWSAGWLRTVRSRLEIRPDALLLGHTSVVRTADLSGSDSGWNPPEPPFLLFVFGAIALARPTFETIGGVDASLRFSEDLAFSMVARERGVPFVIVPETTHFYRLHGRNSVTGRDLRERNVIRVLHESLRRRASGDGRTTRSLPALRRSGAPGFPPS